MHEIESDIFIWDYSLANPNCKYCYGRGVVRMSPINGYPYTRVCRCVVNKQKRLSNGKNR